MVTGGSAGGAARDERSARPRASKCAGGKRRTPEETHRAKSGNASSTAICAIFLFLQKAQGRERQARIWSRDDVEV
jgi:hypothetical protein